MQKQTNDPKQTNNPKRSTMQQEQTRNQNFTLLLTITVLAIIMAVLLLFLDMTPLENTGVPDKEIIGVWVLRSVKYEGEDEIALRSNYTRVKYYGPDGEYACAEILMPKAGQYRINPHAYGQYTFKNGDYTEMGQRGTFVLKDNVTAYGKWNKCNENWKKISIPDRLLKEIILWCKANRKLTPELQDDIHKYILNQ